MSLDVSKCSKTQHIFDRFEWTRTVLLYETRAFETIVGMNGGFLLASTIHEFLIYEQLQVFGWELQFNNNNNTLQDQLIEHVGNNFASEFSFWELESNRGFAELC